VQVAHERLQVLALLDLRGEPDGHRQRRLDGRERHDVAPRAQDRQAPVAGDREEPGAQRDGPLVGPQGPVRGDEGVLERVLGLLGGAEQVTAEREQRPVVPVVERLEGAIVARAHACDQSLIGQMGQQLRRRLDPSSRRRNPFLGRVFCEHVLVHLSQWGIRELGD
jgi:hypothetical protein